MPSAGGPQGPEDHEKEDSARPSSQSVELQLFESLVHHLIEKGVLTKNDALSVIQTVAQVKRSELDTGVRRGGDVRSDLVLLERLYASFELMTERFRATQLRDADNVLQLRPPLHGDNPRFPKDD